MHLTLACRHVRHFDTLIWLERKCLDIELFPKISWHHPLVSKKEIRQLGKGAEFLLDSFMLLLRKDIEIGYVRPRFGPKESSERPLHRFVVVFCPLRHELR